MAIRGFDSLEEMLAAMDKDEERAAAAIRPRQRRDLGWGTVALRMVPTEQGEIPVWTEVYTQEQANKGEDEGTRKDLQDSHRRGYRYGRHFSIACPEGELGSAHISTMWPITRRDFGIAKEIGWFPTPEHRGWFNELAARISREIQDDAAGMVGRSKFDADEDDDQTFIVVDEGDTP